MPEGTVLSYIATHPDVDRLELVREQTSYIIISPSAILILVHTAHWCCTRPMLFT